MTTSVHEHLVESATDSRAVPSRWQRLCHWLASWWREPQMTAYEAQAQRRVLEGQAALADAVTQVSALELQVDALQGELADQGDRHGRELDALKTEHVFELRKKAAEVDAARVEVQLLAEVVERNRKRVEAETAHHAAQAARGDAAVQMVSQSLG